MDEKLYKIKKGSEFEFYSTEASGTINKIVGKTTQETETASLITVNEYSQVELDRDDTMRKVSIESTLPEITQNVREGYNKLNISDFKNGAYNYGTSNQVPAWSSNNIRLTLEPNKAIDVLPNTEYTIIFPKEYSYSIAQLTSEKLTNGDSGWITYTEDNKKTIFTTKDNTKYIAFNVKNSTNNDSEIDLETFKESKVLLYAGTEEKPYEQYGASPSMDFPSEVQVASEQNIIIRGNNMCKEYSNTNEINRYAAALYIEADLKPNTRYTLSLLTPNFDATYYRNEDLTSSWISFTNNGNRVKFSFTTNSDISKAYYSPLNAYSILKNSQVQSEKANFSEIMLVEGNTDLPYEPYYGTDITIPLVNSAIGQYTDTIDRENNVQNKVIQELTLTGDEDYYYSSVYNNIYQYNLNISNPSLSNDDFIVRAKSNYFKGIGRKNSWLYDNTVTTEAKKIRFMTSQYATVEDFKAKVKELYNAGTPVKVYYVSETIDKIPLSEEIKQELNKFKLYDDLNNVFIDNGSLSFIYNKSLLRAFEEQSELSASLLERIQALEAAQVNQVGGN